MSGSLEILLVTLKEKHSATVAHVFAIRVKIGPINGLAASNSHAVVAFRTLTAVVPGYKQVVIIVVFEDKWSFNRIRSGKVGRRIFRRIRIGRECLLAVGISQVITAGNGARFFACSNMHSRVETGKLNAIPERAPNEPRVIFIIDDKIGVDGVPVVAPLAGGDDTALIVPYREGE